MQKIFQNRETYRKDKTWGNKRNRKQKLLANLNYQNRQNIFAKLSKLLTEFSSVSQSCPTVCNPMDCSTPGLPVHHQLWEFTQTHVHWVGDAIQSSHPLSWPSPPAFNLSQHQGLFKWVSSSHQVPKILEFQLQFPVNIQDWFPLGWTGWISLLSKGRSRVFSNTTVQKHQFFSPQLSL